MSVRGKFIVNVFDGYRDPLGCIEEGAGAPTHNAARKGIYYYDTTNGECYQASNKTGVWVKLA